MNKLLKSTYILLAPMLLAANVGTTSTPDGDGIITYTQAVNSSSNSSYRTYQGTTYSNFNVYGCQDSDFGWKHDFPNYNLANLNVVSAELLIEAYDVDAEPSHGLNGEYNQISIDQNNLNPGFLQGSNNTTYETTFDIPLNYISDDGEMSVFMDVDIRRRGWCVRVPESKVVIKYKIIENNDAPYKAKIQEVASASSNTALTVTILGSDVDGIDIDVLDPNDDNVTYKYRWFVDLGQGEYVDADFAGKGTITGNTVPAVQVKLAEKWRVEVTPTDEHGAIGVTTVYDFPTIAEKDTDNDSIPDAYDKYINDPKRAFNLYYPAKNEMNTLMYEDTWPNKGDYDMNDVVINFNYKFVADSNNLIKDIYLTLDYKAYGGIIKHGFALEIADLDRTNILNISTLNNGTSVALTSEEGHRGDKTVIVITENLTKYMPIAYSSTGNHTFFNTQNNIAQRSTESVVLHIELDEARAFDISKAPFNPFIFRQYGTYLEVNEGRAHEIHLIDNVPSDLADKTLFGTGDDVSVFLESVDPLTLGQFYRTKDGLPWALEISGAVNHPAEKTDFLNAYPNLWDWAKASGSTNKDWHQHRNSQHTWKNQ